MIPSYTKANLEKGQTMESADKLFYGKKIILGSASPRRKELLKGLDIDFTIDTGNNFKEIVPENLPLEEIPLYMAEGKSKGFHRDLQEDEVLITADTMVLCNNEILGKPDGKEGAIQMLKKLSNNKHTVITGVFIRDAKKSTSFSSFTDVYFDNLEESQIEYYVNKYSPFDKAGSYAVQEWIGHVGINRIDGSYYNVVGLPVSRLYKVLTEFITKG